MEKNDTQQERLPYRVSFPKILFYLWLTATLSVLLLYILFPHFQRATGSRDYTRCQSNLKNIGAALELYSQDNKGLYPPRMEMLTPDYMKTIPRCPGEDLQGKEWSIGRFLQEEGYEKTYHTRNWKLEVRNEG